MYQKVQQFSLAELSQWLKEVCKKIQRHIQEMRSDKTKSFVKRAVEHVHSHYMDKDLTVEALSQELHVSAAYFSTVFKRETGKSFINYLTDYRMEKAIRLLMEEEEKTYIIAESVGYSDPNYFSYAFKRSLECLRPNINPAVREKKYYRFILMVGEGDFVGKKNVSKKNLLADVFCKRESPSPFLLLPLCVLFTICF